LLAYSKATVVKYLKSVGEYEAPELSEALDSLTEDEQNQLGSLSRAARQMTPSKSAGSRNRRKTTYKTSNVSRLLSKSRKKREI